MSLQVGAAALLGDGAGGADTRAMHAMLEEERRQWLRLLLISLLLAVPVLAISAAPPAVRESVGCIGGVPGFYSLDALLAVLAAPVQFGVGWRFLRGAWKGVVRGRCAMGEEG